MAHGPSTPPTHPCRFCPANLPQVSGGLLKTHRGPCGLLCAGGEMQGPRVHTGVGCLGCEGARAFYANETNEPPLSLYGIFSERLIRIAVRDGWICHLCQRPTDRRLRVIRGKPRRGDGTPTVDHLIPKSHGGSGRDSNLRLAHNKCNTLRGTRPVDVYTAETRIDWEIAQLRPPFEVVIQRVPTPPNFRLRLVRETVHGPPRWEVTPLSDSDFPRGYGIETPVYPLLDKPPEST